MSIGFSDCPTSGTLRTQTPKNVTTEMASQSPATADLPERNPTWFRFSLRSLLILVVLVSLPLSWVRIRLDRARQQREAIETLGKIRCFVHDPYSYAMDERAILDEEQSAAPQWLRSLLGNDVFTTVPEVYLVDSEATDADLEHVAKLVGLEMLALEDTQITDAGLDHLRSMNTLREVYFSGTGVTDDGVMKLKEALPNLQIHR